MFRKLIIVFFSLVIGFVGFINPVRADSNIYQTFERENISISEEPNILDNSFTQSAIKQAEVTAGAIAGGAAVCYGVSGISTTVFPPAAALLPYCPFVGAFVGNQGINETIKVAKYVPVKQTAKILSDTAVYGAKNIVIKPEIKTAKILSNTAVYGVKNIVIKPGIKVFSSIF